MFWYHGTSQRRKNMILSSGFKEKKGLWGKGVYLTSSREGARIFGDALLKVRIDESKVTPIIFEEFKREYPDEQTWAKAVGGKDYSAIKVTYCSGEIELCIFDPEIIIETRY